jgi:integrase
VPLSQAVLDVLERARRIGEGSEFLFPNTLQGRQLSNMAMLKMLERMGSPELTVHGFRSSFRDWVAEQTAFPSEVAEMALAHAVGAKVEAAYRRGDLFRKRRLLMDAWAEYCSNPAQAAAAVVRMRKGGADG